MGNPLAEYVQAPTPYFDFSDARTYYDGLWGSGLWPPEGYPGVGMNGLGESMPGGTLPPVMFPGDWARLRAASLRGLGNGAVIANLNQPTVDLSNCDPATIDAINQGLISAGQVICASSIPVGTSP